MLLEITDLSMYYHTAMVLNKVNLSINAGEFVAVVGPNGAGKTTLLRAIAGLTRWERDTMKGMRTMLSNIVTKGKVVFNGERVDNLPAHEVMKRGLVICPERGKPFAELSVEDNLKAGALICPKTEKAENLEKVYQMFPVLEERRRQVSGTLSGGERTMLAIGRALMSSPKLLCLDEPSTGLAPKAKEVLFEKILEIQSLKINTMLVEQDVSFAFALSTRNLVMSKGRIIAEGTDRELLKDENIRKIYLGL